MKENQMRTMLAEAGRIARFGFVGLTAMATHIAVANVALAYAFGSAYVASLSGFLVAFCVSYLGHYHFTFGEGQGHTKALPRFFLVAVSGFLASLLVLKVIATYGSVPPAASLTVSILVIPGLTYLAARLWAFR
jgi:putative flippase GtrA